MTKEKIQELGQILATQTEQHMTQAEDEQNTGKMMENVSLCSACTQSQSSGSKIKQEEPPTWEMFEAEYCRELPCVPIPPTPRLKDKDVVDFFGHRQTRKVQGWMVG